MSESGNKSRLAAELGISRSSLYYRPKIPDKDEALRREIELVMERNPGYGHRRVAAELGINKKRARRVMRKFNLKPARRSKTPRKPKDEGRTKSSRLDITNLLCPIVPDMLWTGDFTYLSFQGDFIYLAVVQDRYSAFIHACRVMNHHSKELVLAVMKEALKKNNSAPDWFHSDQGSEYTSKEFEELLLKNKINISHSPKGSPWRNGAQESFFGRFKIEFGDPNCYSSLAELMEAIYGYIFYYNYERIHTRLKASPYQFRKNLKNTKSVPDLANFYTATNTLEIQP